MRLAIVNQFYLPDSSPTAHLCASLAEHRALMGDKVTVITGHAAYGALEAPGCTCGSRVYVRRVWTSRRGSSTRIGRFVDWATFYLAALWTMVWLPRQDVLVSLTTPPFIGLAAALHKLLHPSTKLVLWNMDCYPEAVERTGMLKEGGLTSRMMRAVNRTLFRQLDHLICLDDAMAELLLSQYAPAGRQLPCSVIPNWESAALFPPENMSPMRAGEFTVLYLGNAGFGHEFQTVIDAAERLRNEPVKFLFVGGGALATWIEKAAQHRKLAKVECRDFVPKEHTPALMRQAECALITLEDRMLGVMSPSKLHANLAMGLPILYVGPAGGNVDQAIQQFVCGISLRPGDAKGLADALKSLVADPRLASDLRRRAREAFEEAYCDRVTLHKFDFIFDRFAPKEVGGPEQLL